LPCAEVDEHGVNGRPQSLNPFSCSGRIGLHAGKAADRTPFNRSLNTSAKP
jgi:hypothetical protein